MRYSPMDGQVKEKPRIRKQKNKKTSYRPMDEIVQSGDVDNKDYDVATFFVF